MSAAQSGGGKRKSGPFGFAKPYLDFIDKGKLYGVVYIVMAILSLLFPIILLYLVIDSGFLKVGAKHVYLFICVFAVIILACLIGFQMWLERRKKITSIAASEFIATPIFSEIFQTLGEWTGTFIGLVGAVGGIAAIFVGDETALLYAIMRLSYIHSGVRSIIVEPITGFTVIIVSRFLAEQMRVLTSIANSVKKIAK